MGVYHTGDFAGDFGCHLEAFAYNAANAGNGFSDVGAYFFYPRNDSQSNFGDLCKSLFEFCTNDLSQSKQSVLYHAALKVKGFKHTLKAFCKVIINKYHGCLQSKGFKRTLKAPLTFYSN